MLVVMIPGYSMDEYVTHMTAETAKAWRPYCDMIIISEDGQYEQEVADACDIYIVHDHIGVADSSNIGWQRALDEGADFVAIMDSDVTPAEGNLQDLCILDRVCVPQTIDWPDRVSVAPMVVVPKEVAIERGMYDSLGRRHAYKHFDADLQVRYRDLIEFHSEFKINHKGSQTTGRFLTKCNCGRCNDAY